MASVGSGQGASHFEKGRIHALQEERIAIQKKTFTKWINSHLSKANLHIENLFEDLHDGKALMRLLEVISGESVGRPNHGKLRVQKMENINKALRFLSSKKVRLESIGAEDIADGNTRLILGLIWTVILRFQIQDIQVEDDGSTETKSAKEALLLWCQRKTAGYPGVDVRNFTSSWRSGLAFNALLHAHRPELLNFEVLKHQSNIDNLNNAFKLAHERLGIARLLDAEDLDVERPDEKSVMTYVAAYYHYFAKMKTEKTGGKRIAKIISQIKEIDNLQDEYERLVSDLLEWIQSTTRKLSNRDLPNLLAGIQEEMARFKTYRMVEKPPKYAERGNIEATLFSIQTKIRVCRRKIYVPPEGKLINDIEKKWALLEEAEHKRETALREELARQEKLERLAEKFERKVLLRESWLEDMMSVLIESVTPSSDVHAVDAATKRHEAITADVMARKERFADLESMALELAKEGYHREREITKRSGEVSRKWKELLTLLDKRKTILKGVNELMDMFREVDGIMAEMEEIQVTLHSDERGKHLQAVEDLLQKQSLVDTQIATQGERINQVNIIADRCLQQDHPESPTIKRRTVDLNVTYNAIKEMSHIRKSCLEDSLKFFQFMRDSEEEESWLMEKQRIAKSAVTGRDLRSVLSMKQKHAVLEAEVMARQRTVQGVLDTGQELIDTGHPSKRKIKTRMESVGEKMEHLKEYAEGRKLRLQMAVQSHEYYIDANEAESWMREKMPLVCSDDYGKDADSAKTMLQKHTILHEEIQAYENEVVQLRENGEKMMTTIKSNQTKMQGRSSPLMDEESFTTETVDVSYEVEEEETVEREVIKEVIEERKYPQVKALYNYKGEDMKIAKGEIMILIEKSNTDWWSVRRGNAQEGFIPANYVKEVTPKVVKKKVKRKVKVPEKVMVKKTKIRQEIIKKKKPKDRKSVLSRSGSVRRQSHHFDEDNIELRLASINGTYKRLRKLSEARSRYLEDAIKLFTFYHDCDEFQDWMREKEKALKKKESFSEHVEATKRKFENLLTDLVANQGRVERINKMADRFVETGHSKQGDVRSRQKEVNQQWQRVQQLKADKEKMLEGASSIELYNHSWGETKEWIMDKFKALTSDDPGNQTLPAEALQRKYENLQRELTPVMDKLRKLGLLAIAVKTSYPDEGDHISNRQDEISKLWDNLEDKATERKTQLAQSRDITTFHNESKELITWCNEMNGKLLDTELAKDVVGSEDLLKRHGDLLQDIQAHEDKFTKLSKLGQQLLKTLPDSVTIAHKVEKLSTMKESLATRWDKRNKQLQDALDLAILNREADQIDVTTSGHEDFLDFNDLGSTVESVISLLKRHEDFMKKFDLQEEKVKGLKDMAQSLIDRKHYAKNYVVSRRDEVTERRIAVKERSEQRYQALKESKEHQEFVRDADEISSWLAEKFEIADDESYRELTNIPGKVKKHQAFQAEIIANKERLDKLNETGTALVDSVNANSEEIQVLLQAINSRWMDLSTRADERGEKLQQAVEEQELIRAMEDSAANIQEIEIAMTSQDVGHDLRSVKSLLKRQQVLDAEMSLQAERMKKLSQNSKKLADQGHFDKDKIKSETAYFTQRFNELEGPAEKRRKKLEESLRVQQFYHDVDTELQWIKDHSPAASSTNYGRDFTSTQSMLKKHQKLEAEITGHQPVIDKVLSTGQHLIDSGHFALHEVQERCQDLSLSWDQLLDQALARKNHLDMAFEAQKYYSEAVEAESWMTEKLSLVMITDYGKDEDATEKMLAKNKALELNIEHYESVIRSLGDRKNRMVSSRNPEAEGITEKQEELVNQYKNVMDQGSHRTFKLEQTKLMHQYVRESDELGEWIEEQYQVASSEEYGQDYEHLEELSKKFDEFCRHVDSGMDQFKRCDKQVQSLVAERYEQSDSLIEKQDSLQQALDMLMDRISSRREKLEAARQIHQFNRDYEEAMSRIQEKYAIIPDELGKDVNSVQSLVRKHEAFENDLVALEQQLQSLVNEAVRLQDEYPGENAMQLEEQQGVMVADWNLLQERATERRSSLQAANDFHRLMATCKDLIKWSDNMNAEIQSEEPIKDVYTTMSMINNHAQLRSEIEAREDNFSSLVQAGEILIQQGHFARQEIQERIEAVLQAREDLHGGWQNKKVKLDQSHQQQQFYREAKILETLSSQQEVYLQSSDMGATVEEVEAQIKKHEAFEKVLATQEEKTSTLQVFGSQLMEEGHFDSPGIQEKLKEVTKRRARLRDLSAERRHKLSTAKLYAQFNRDIAEAQAWIGEKWKTFGDGGFESCSNLREKMKRLQKHQAFEAEIKANEKLISDVKQEGESLLKQQHSDSVNIKQRMSDMMKSWNDVRQASAKRGQHLEEVRDLLEYNQMAEKTEKWTREKEVMVSAHDVGNDYEHCMELQKKLNDIGSDLSVDDVYVNQMCDLGERLVKDNNPDQTNNIRKRTEDIKTSWQALQSGLTKYRKELTDAADIHAFNRDIDDVMERISEKRNAMDIDEVGKDVSSVESLQRRHGEIVRDSTVIQTRLKELKNAAAVLGRKQPSQKAAVLATEQEAERQWDALCELSQQRQEKLASSLNLQQFYKDYREMMSWTGQVINHMTSGELAKASSEVENLCELHKERKAEIDGRNAKFESLHETGSSLVDEGHYAAADIKQCLEELTASKAQVETGWEQRKTLLAQCLDLQVFKEYMEQADSWLATKEAFITQEDAGDSLTMVESMARKHEGFEKTLESQVEKIDELQVFASQLVSGGHYDSGWVQSKCQAIADRRDKLYNETEARRKRLTESLEMHQFLQDIYEVGSWISEKTQIACDESFRDESNLTHKLQKHQAFEAELLSNRGRVDSIQQRGEAMIEKEHHAAADIREKLTELEQRWQHLMDRCAWKQDHLQQAYKAHVLQRTIDEMSDWLNEVENHLQTSDVGKDMASVKHLIKKHQAVNLDVESYEEKVIEIKQTAETFKGEENFLADDMIEKTDTVYQRYDAVNELAAKRQKQLDDAFTLYKFLRDVDDELSWIQEKMTLASSTDYGSSLTAVQNLFKRHQILESEITAHEQLISAVSNTAHQLVDTNHYGSNEIKDQETVLNSRWSQLKEAATGRKRKLSSALDIQKFFSDLMEAESWMNDRRPLVTSTDYGKNEDSVVSLLKKLDGLELDLEGYSGTLQALATTASNLSDPSNPAVKDVKKRQTEIENEYQEILDLLESRKQVLMGHLKQFEFLREMDEMMDWIQEKEVLALSEDYGKDLEHVEILQTRFNSFTKDILTNEGRIRAIGNKANTLIKSGIDEDDTVATRCQELEIRWDELKEATNARTQALADVRVVHAFDRDIAETLAWIQEKDTAISSEDYGHDLPSVQALVRRHSGFERDLVAVEEKVESTSAQAAQLVEEYTDAYQHISEENDTMVSAWNMLLERAALRKDRLMQAEQLQLYFNEFRELSTWINEMNALLSSDETPHDVSSAEALLNKHSEHQLEISLHATNIAQFIEAGNKLIEDDHFLAKEVETKVEQLDQAWINLNAKCDERRKNYEAKLDTFLLQRDLEGAESWLNDKDPILEDQSFLDDSCDIEELLKKQEDFEKMIEAQEERFAALTRLTKAEANRDGGHTTLDDVLREFDKVEKMGAPPKGRGLLNSQFTIEEEDEEVEEEERKNVLQNENISDMLDEMSGIQQVNASKPQSVGSKFDQTDLVSSKQTSSQEAVSSSVTKQPMQPAPKPFRPPLTSTKTGVRASKRDDDDDAEKSGNTGKMIPDGAAKEDEEEDLDEAAEASLRSRRRMLIPRISITMFDDELPESFGAPDEADMKKDEADQIDEIIRQNSIEEEEEEGVNDDDLLDEDYPLDDDDLAFQDSDDSDPVDDQEFDDADDLLRHPDISPSVDSSRNQPETGSSASSKETIKTSRHPLGPRPQTLPPAPPNFDPQGQNLPPSNRTSQSSTGIPSSTNGASSRASGGQRSPRSFQDMTTPKPRVGKVTAEPPPPIQVVDLKGRSPPSGGSKEKTISISSIFKKKK
ncbi:spectrin beta chain, non-erythrocytic 5-like isoform X1 [Lytechinus pictus]|uniref:spectrin beta chain, non-erythrocytic 5-like isoform X1 n=1 Tax=Lytechinus pictus TaxID=7653 RepID=UPI0030B9BC28